VDRVFGYIITAPVVVVLVGVGLWWFNRQEKDASQADAQPKDVESSPPDSN
jgi:hypothetical protein